MQHEQQGQMAHILDGRHDWTMPYKELQVQEWRDGELERSHTRMSVEHYRHAKEGQALICT